MVIALSIINSFLIHQLLGHLLQVARKVADAEKLDEGYRVGEYWYNIITSPVAIYFLAVIR